MTEVDMPTPRASASSRHPARRRALTVPRVLSRVLAGTLVLVTAACSSQLGVFKQGPGAFLFPELLPDTVPLSPPLSQLGAICGNVQDPNNQTLPGATVTDGAAVTVTSDGKFVFPTREAAATDNPVPVLGIDGATLSAGDFVLDGLPLGANTITVSFDEVKTEVPVFVGLSSFSAKVNAAAHLGGPNYQASIANPDTSTSGHCGVIVLPFYRSVANADGLRVADIEPAVVQGQLTLASGSAPVVSWPKGSKVSIVLRVTPPSALPIQISTASIVYENDSGQPLPDPANQSVALQINRAIDPVVTALPGGTSKISGPPATVVLDLATSKIASDDVAAVLITFVKPNPTNPASPLAATDPLNHALSVTVPLRLQVSGAAP